MKSFTLDDSELHETKFSPTCVFCKHLKLDPETRTCVAFETRIPDEIWEGENKHTEPYPGDRGITFERRSV